MTSPAAPARGRVMRRALMGLGLAAFGRGLAEMEAVVEWHRTLVFPRLTALLQWISGTAVSTLGEVAALGLTFLAISWLLARRTEAIGDVALAMGFLVFAFYGTWGLAYRYPPLSGRLAPLPLSPEGGETSAGLTGLVEASALLAARAAEAPLAFSGDDRDFLARVNAGLRAGSARVPESIEASPVAGVAFGPAKPSRVSFALSRLQLSGYYFPWTGEAQINSEMPRSLWPRVAAHEKAHQRGFARENEASVIGVLSCLLSPDPTVFYGGTLGLFVSLDRELARADPEARLRIWGTLPRRVTEDLRREAAFWKAHEGVAGEVSERVNDTYLKAQGVRSGVASYAETTRLLLQAMQTDSLGLSRLMKSPPLLPHEK